MRGRFSDLFSLNPIRTNDCPCTLARFRADCQDGFTSLFTQVLMIAGRAGLARFGTVAIDGTKIAANASIDANRGQEWLAVEVNPDGHGRRTGRRTGGCAVGPRSPTCRG
jgi:hypothetical protein